MKKYILIALLIFFISCDKKSKVEKEVEEIPLSLTIERFDKIFYETPISDFQQMRKKYAAFFPTQYPDSVFINKIKNPLYRELYDEVQKKYANFQPIQTEIEDVFRHIKYYFPTQKLPQKVTTVISEMDYQNKVIYTDSLLIISLDLYLGKEHKFYEFPDYFRQTFERSQIMPDIVSDFSTRIIAQPRDKSFLAQMIYFGKEQYLKDLLLPNVEDFVKMGYSKEQQIWCEENEDEIWRYFIEDNLLYDSDSKLIQRFIAPAPFSKFYLEIDNESPGRTGVWIGWQIVRSFMKNNEVSLADLMAMDAKEIFTRSKYKPKK
ncbi:gliding motility lipoprotein GldB [Flavobacterium sp.]|uniref:gliding motility lipoprotein GldB n=1 Tax=Flavobacterium sp. TaxID=239 RepID=UPI0025C55ABC|nr:gliding motility lipoprotein GldB [Flavobacterium sp.]MBA4154278.1 gliding motility lipoprotein GldB [Flavobacterium sp.]